MDHITEIENDSMGEKIILYHKQIMIFSKKLREVYQNFPIEGINDIVRLNVSRFLYRMDNPKTFLPILDGRGYRKTIGERVYHLTMILRYSVESENKYERYRIVLTRSGIKRIEMVAPKLWAV
jgi:DNA-binding XRE family transcriptional regulator